MFERVERDGITIHTVPSLFESAGIGIAFSERGGGVSGAPYESLNLAGHVGDVPALVDANRERLLAAIGIGTLRERLTTAEQVHGIELAEVTPDIAGAGALIAGGAGPVRGVDGLWTRERGVPLMLMFADCVPVILARPSIPAVAVVHAGWRGVAAGIVGSAARTLTGLPGPDDIVAFIGPHIGACCYPVGAECVSHFDNALLPLPRFRPASILGRPWRMISSDQESRRDASGTWVFAPRTTPIASTRTAPTARPDGTARSP